MDVDKILETYNSINLLKADEKEKLITVIALGEEHGEENACYYKVQVHDSIFNYTYRKLFKSYSFATKKEAIDFIKDIVDRKISAGFTDDYTKMPHFKHEFIKCWDSSDDEILYIFEFFPNGSYEEVARFNAYHPFYKLLVDGCMKVLTEEAEKAYELLQKA